MGTKEFSAMDPIRYIEVTSDIVPSSVKVVTRFSSFDLWVLRMSFYRPVYRIFILVTCPAHGYSILIYLITLTCSFNFCSTFVLLIRSVLLIVPLYVLNTPEFIYVSCGQCPCLTSVSQDQNHKRDEDLAHLVMPFTTLWWPYWRAHCIVSLSVTLF